ncbi:MAG: ribose-phosphate pyrophosphokinase [Proteobacteria bacterium]|jgi:ribose-phosphate pyrophosphokinase|uniref:Ribose-phosphate pyrophosphokinase n=1 Tax=Candidatus Fonsibacter lacus TaxID=2576439 RepID=A0A845S6Y5_9PROT|nr:ribose-phosphate pyrophosphokinase [Candidatus Fonsibacter lacus]NBP60014.1 ribose-phosphate pyrophosphokinase [Pseudomonadota bacterium]NBP99818.1 ribose-phosphate pyrophosphokinase [Pseudomonadota bacterium]NBQ46137.1 ribose-phosphate pyrophosphokinase [Pseudomonadota bacterium]NBV39874.1 ribose-phosphate pyrophosphokinase [Candidatus Fonsibacter lacus]
MKIVSGTSSISLSDQICKYLKTKPTQREIVRFADSEVYVEIKENMRGNDVYLIQSTSYPANDNIMELLICIDSLRRSSAKNITAVIPYFGYARQDRKVVPRSPISAKLVANLITNAGANRVLTMDLHANQIQGFFDIPVDNLYAAPVLLKHILKNIGMKNIVCVAPDVGGVERARAIGKRLNAGLAIIDKRRERPGQSEVMNVIGEVKNKSCIIIDDLIDSGGTICNAADALIDKGAKEVYCYVVHGVLTGSSIDKIKKSKMKKIVITDTIDNTKKIKGVSKIEVVSIAPLIAEAIKRISQSTSVSSLFK